MGHEAKKFLVLEQNSFWLFEWPQRREKNASASLRSPINITISTYLMSNSPFRWSTMHRLFSLPLVLRLSPPSHRTALCSSGGRVACAAASVLASLPSCGGAFWQGDMVIQFSFWKFPSSGIITRCIRVDSHVRTHSHSLSALSLSLYLHHL